MKKWILGFLGVAILIFGAVSLFIVSKLPSRGEIISAVAKTPEAVPSESIGGTPEAKPSSKAEVVDPVQGEAIEAARKKRELKQILSLMDEDFRDIRVCDHLGQSKVDLKKKSFGFDDIFSDDRNDSLTEAYRAPLKAIFQEPRVSGLLQELRELDPEMTGKSENEKDGLFKKIGFYSRVAQAGIALNHRKKHFENLGDRAVHLSVLAKIALLKPEMKNSTSLVDTCRSIENPETVTDHAALAVERKQIIDLIAAAGLKPADLEFNPSDWVRFSVEAGKDGLKVTLKGNEFNKVPGSSSEN